MNDAFYHIVVIVVAVVAVVRGFRKGFTGQVSGVLGFAFGAVSAHVFSPEIEPYIRSLFPGIRNSLGASFIYSIISAVVVYTAVYMFFSMFTKILKSAMQLLYVGMLDSLMGSAFCLFKYLLVLSILYNLILCVNPRGALLRYAGADDGNVVECVLMIAPGVLGCVGSDDLFHLIQLKDAKKISDNISPRKGVIVIKRKYDA